MTTAFMPSPSPRRITTRELLHFKAACQEFHRLARDVERARTTGERLTLKGLKQLQAQHVRNLITLIGDEAREIAASYNFDEGRLL